MGKEKAALGAAEKLRAVSARLGDAIIDPAVWPEIMQQISEAVGAKGAALLQSDVRTSDIPRTCDVHDIFDHYFADGWHKRDVRAEKGVPLLLRGEKVIVDEDIMTADEIRRDEFYSDWLPSQGLRWFAAIGFWSGSDLWGLTLQRSANSEPFVSADKQKLALLSDRLTETATLSKAVGRAVLTSITNALSLMGRPALAVDRRGFVLEASDEAEALFDNDMFISNRRLVLSDAHAASKINDLFDQLRTTPDSVALTVAPIVVRRREKRPLIVRALPVDGAARSPFLGARAILVLGSTALNVPADPKLLSLTLGLSPAEAKLASLIASGFAPERAAAQLGVSPGTVRNQLKSIFAKTGTHRQAELVALVSRI